MRKDEKISLDKLLAEATLYDSPLTEKQKDILDAAEKLFAEHGYSDTPTAEIARKAGVTERTLFKHFPTKGALLKRVMFPLLLKFVIPTQIRHLKEIFKSVNKPGDLFKALFRDRLKLANQHKGKLRFMLVELLKNESLRHQVAKLWHDQLWLEALATIDGLKKQGKLRKDIRSENIGRAIISFVITYVLSSQLFPNKWDSEQVLEDLAKILLEGVEA